MKQNYLSLGDLELVKSNIDSLIDHPLTYIDYQNKTISKKNLSFFRNDFLSQIEQSLAQVFLPQTFDLDANHPLHIHE